MKKSEKILLIILGVLIVICLSVFFVFKVMNKNSAKYDYVFVTDMAIKTMLNDGGTHTDIYYEVDLKNNSVVKKQDEYKGFEGKISENILKTYRINNSKNKKIKEIFDKIIEEKDIDISSSNVYTRYYYVLKFNDEEIITYNSNLINEFESMFK